MKKLLNTLSLTLVIFASSQTLQAQVLSAGPRIGMNIVPQEKDLITGSSSAIRTNAGGFIEIPIGQRFGISTGLNYSGKKKTYSYSSSESLLGSLLGGLNIGGLNNLIDDTLLNQVRGFINDTVYSYTRGAVKLNYIEIPIMFQYHLKQFSFGAGGYVAYLISARSKEELRQESALLDIAYPLIDSIPVLGPVLKGLINSKYPGYLEPKVSESSDKTKYRSFDSGMMLEVSYHGVNNIDFNVRYTQGFMKYSATALKKNDYNRTIMISLAYNFNLRGSKDAKSKYHIDTKKTEEKL